MAEKLPPSREQRLAAKLRENLKRRKEQARARTPAAPAAQSPVVEPPAVATKAPDGSDS